MTSSRVAYFPSTGSAGPNTNCRWQLRALRCPIGLAIGGLLIFAITAPAAPPAERGQAERAQVEWFESRVRPILVEQCVQCHGPQKQEAGLRLDSRAAALKGGESGPALVVGQPNESLLMEAVRFEGLEMPPDEKLTDAQIVALETWIKAGAIWPEGELAAAPALGDQPALFALAKKHWSLQPVQQPPVPQLPSTAWVRTPVDAFLWEKMAAAGLTPAAPADPATLIRRVYFDLIGLPPTAEQIEQFSRAASADSYAALVEQLLASPQYGQRWGRHWLDVARYADTRDFLAAGADRRYPYAYTYRDWVVQAYNNDLPYDQFIRQQLAADFYAQDPHDPSLAALGLLTVGARFQNNANEQIADRIDVVGRAFLGLSISCARCHDHKYDPIPTADYYALYGVFASCQEPEEMPLLAGMIPPAELFKDYEKARAEKLADKTRYAEQLRDEATTELRARWPDYLAGYYELSIAKSESIRGLLSTRKLKEIAMTPLADSLERVKRTDAGKNHPVYGPLMHLVSVIDQNFAGHLKRTASSGQTQGEKNQQPINALVLQQLRSSPPADKPALLKLYAQLFSEAEQRWHAARQANPAASGLDDAAWEAVRQALYAADSPFVLQADRCVEASRLLGSGRQKLAQLDNAIKDVEITHPGAPARAFVMVDKPTPVEPVIFLRGDPQRRGDQVPRHFLTVLGGGADQPFVTGSGRQELAEAIANRHNPLTARVYVNRVWLHLFGQGLVDTPGDFGFRGNSPSHPQLLDWLASGFMEHNWSTKWLVRQIVLSSAYQQASQPTDADTAARLATVDPENRLLSHMARRRRDFEALRDAMLAVSGNLDASLGGRPVDLSATPFTKRRTLYGFVDRLNLDPVFSTFDFASPDVSTAERAITLVPQQALFGMNHPFVIAQARALCATAEFQAARDDATRAAVLYRRVFGRQPAADEARLAAQFVQLSWATVAELESSTGQQFQPVWQYGYGASDPSAAAEDRFHPLPFFDGKNYQAGAQYPDPVLAHVRLSAVGGHPGRDQEHAIVRRWLAPRDAVVAISGTLAHLRDTGDGIRGQILSEGRPLGQWTAFNEPVETTVARVEVRRGQTLDFVVDCRQKPTSDAFTWAPVVTQLQPAPPGKMPAQVWNARSDFAAPPPPRLTPWEQSAQALLLTNEFWFVD